MTQTLPWDSSSMKADSRALINFLIEISQANDSTAAERAFLFYLQDRFAPTEIQEFDLKDCPIDVDESKFFREIEERWIFLLNISFPRVYILNNCKATIPSAFEISSVTKGVRAFRDKVETMTDLKGLTYTDDVTGLYNQRYLEMVLDREVSLARRNETSFSILFLDLDHFKNVNDQHGHIVGSQLLYEVGQVIKLTLRESDIVFRYGGDEFVAVCSHTNADEAVLVAERVREKVEKKRFLVKQGMEIRLTTSIGVASFPKHAASTEEILSVADAALYGSKRQERNQVVLGVGDRKASNS